MTLVWLDNRLLSEDQAFLSTSDRGFTLADGVFETIRAVRGTPIWLPDHLHRLRSSARCLNISVPYSDKILEVAVSQLIERMAYPEAAVRITLTRGQATKRGLWSPNEGSKPTMLITAAPSGKPTEQVIIVCESTRRNEYSPLSRIKSLSYADNILARREAIERGAGDGLLINSHGNIACGTVGNVFFRSSKEWTTPPISDGVMPGLARHRIIKILNATERSLHQSKVDEMEAALLTNSLGCTIVRSINGRVLEPFRNSEIDSIYSI